jgi:hypothetical protein
MILPEQIPTAIQFLGKHSLAWLLAHSLDIINSIPWF